jgi:hypothetical protein
MDVLVHNITKKIFVRRIGFGEKVSVCKDQREGQGCQMVYFQNEKSQFG